MTPSRGWSRIVNLLARVPRVLWLILLLALAVRVVLIVATHHFVLVGDPADYHRIARSIAAGHGYPPSVYAPGGGPSALRPPLYPYFLGAVYALFGTSVTVGRLASALTGTVTVALIGLLAWQIWDRRTALISSAIAAVYPPLALVSATLISESIGLPLMLAALSAAIQSRRSNRLRWSAAAGALIGLATLDRPALAIVAIPVALTIWPAHRLRLRSLAGPALALVVGVLLLVPWTIRNANDFHAFVPVSTQSGFLLAGTYNDVSRHDPRFPAANRPVSYVPEYRSLLLHTRLKELPLERRLSSGARRYIGHHRGYVGDVLKWSGLRLLELSHPFAWQRNAYESQGIGRRYADAATIAFWIVAALALAGLGLTRRIPWLLWVTPLLLFASVIVISGDTRYRLPIDPFLILVAAVGLARLTEQVRMRETRAAVGTTSRA